MWEKRKSRQQVRESVYGIPVAPMQVFRYQSHINLRFPLLLLALWFAAAGSSHAQIVTASLVTTYTNPAPSAAAQFGNAIEPVGTNRVVIAAYRDDAGATDAGTAYLFNLEGTLITIFTNPTPANGDSFGSALAVVNNDYVLIGTPTDDTGAFNAGAAYLFSTNGSLLTTFTNPVSRSGDGFGFSVAGLSENRLIIGAPNTLGGDGTAYLFSTNGTRLTTFSTPVPFSRFGNSVAAVGTDKVLIGAPFGTGTAHLFSTNGTLLTTFTNPFPAVDFFGFALSALGGDRVIIGAWQPFMGTPGGAAYLFNVNGALLTTFTNPIPAVSARFGYELVAVGSDKVLIGAVFDDTGATNSGAAHLFSTNGTLLATFTNPIPANAGYFGIALAAVGPEKVIIGANGDNTGAAGAGVAYLFNLETAQLNINRLPDGKICVSWPLTVTGCVVDEASNLTTPPSTNAWHQVSVATYHTNATEHFIVIDPVNSPGFYRLRRP